MEGRNGCSEADRIQFHISLERRLELLLEYF